MEANKFLEIANAKISNDPTSRLTPRAKTALADPDCLIDVHAHVFDRKCLNVPYILLRFAKSKLGFESAGLLGMSEAEIYHAIENDTLEGMEDWQDLEAELEMYENAELFGMDLKEALKVLRKSNMKEILEYYLNKFALTNISDFRNKPFVTGVLLMDLETGWKMRSKKRYVEQIEEGRNLTGQYPVLPFFAIDPRRADKTNPEENLYELFIRAFVNDNAPYFGVKCYPSLGYFPSDARLEPIFEICAKKNIPVLTHCGGEIVSTFEKKIPVKNASEIIQYEIPGNTRAERARFLNDPAHWDSVLNKHDNLKLNLAHFGGDTNWELLGANGSNQRIEKIMDMMKNPNWKVFADFSFNVVESNLFNTFSNQLNNDPVVANRTLYGTDYWVVLPAGDLLKQQEDFLNLLVNHKASLLQTVPKNYLGL